MKTAFVTFRFCIFLEDTENGFHQLNCISLKYFLCYKYVQTFISLLGFACELVDGMASPFFIPMENIKLRPIGLPDLVRPTEDGWRVLATDNSPLVNVTIGEVMNQGVSVQLVKHINVLDYYLLYWEGPKKHMKVSLFFLFINLRYSDCKKIK